MSVQKQIDRLVTLRASEWLEALKTGDERQQAEFVRWVTESPRHMSEFLATVALDREMRELDFKGRFDIEALLGKTTGEVIQLADTSQAAQRTQRAQRSRAKGWRWGLGIAAGLSIFVISALLMRGNFTDWQNYSTAIGEQRSLELPDGSIVYINAQSQLDVRFNAAAREIRLLHGEALFKVAHDPKRPFRVQTRDASVQALGTEFNVYALPDETKVAVLEGKVRVTSETGHTPPAALGAGDTAHISTSGSIARHAHDLNIANTTAWRQRRLVFEQTPLEEVVREFNRYNKSQRLRLDGITPGSRHYSGSFDADDPESLAALISRERDVVVSSTDKEIIIKASESR